MKARVRVSWNDAIDSSCQGDNNLATLILFFPLCIVKISWFSCLQVWGMFHQWKPSEHTPPAGQMLSSASSFSHLGVFNLHRDFSIGHFLFLFACACVCAYGHVCMRACMYVYRVHAWRSEGNLRELVLSLYYVGRRTQVMQLGDKSPYFLSPYTRSPFSY